MLVFGSVFSEIRVLSVDEEAKRRQRRSQLGGLAAGCRQEGVVLELLEGLQRGQRKHLTHHGHRLYWIHPKGRHYCLIKGETGGKTASRMTYSRMT